MMLGACYCYTGNIHLTLIGMLWRNIIQRDKALTSLIGLDALHFLADHESQYLYKKTRIRQFLSFLSNDAVKLEE